MHESPASQNSPEKPNSIQITHKDLSSFFYMWDMIFKKVLDTKSARRLHLFTGKLVTVCESEPVELENLLILQTSHRLSGEMYVIFAALQWFLARLGGTYRISDQWKLTEPALKLHNEISCCHATAVVYSRTLCLLEEIDMNVWKSTKRWCPGHWLLWILTNYAGFAGFSKLCRIMRRSWNYAIPHPRIILWSLG